ncbi:bifunctional DNA primase/polymerase [Pseudonocardia nigra]|uniref:bifunctional DNA primase/polymerase n=1 Tax=Pseudonocardia nigra TaxID=1921578 RepID=UPI001C5FF79D|nr:bifunctional DNA primase/polymerase [Pseudonocardia nigra]
MPGWNSYRAVYGAELRAAAREFDDHGWPVVASSTTSLLLVTGTALDVLEVPAACGRQVCAQLRDAGSVVPVAATPTGEWWFPITPGAQLPAELRETDGVVLHTDGAAVLAPPSELPDGWVHWRVNPALVGYRVPEADLIVHTAADAVRWQADRELHPGAQRPAGAVAVGMRF